MLTVNNKLISTKSQHMRHLVQENSHLNTFKKIQIIYLSSKLKIQNINHISLNILGKPLFIFSTFRRALIQGGA